ncbi:arabinose 5-phosphate isomerase [Trichoderma arundinaceum]|uniref:Arabinose 5-phosphate isomerase n=1 Tax=Trichoderma arundinaceum TaxID=490622 RepID=A0A395N9H3_TRIAR|nr:arabinose 5-phosphate isomerase [Trichoderma arundinaceum]
MVDARHGDHRPIQTSAVIVLGGSKCQSFPPPSPPTPSASPTAKEIGDPVDGFSLDMKSSQEQAIKERRLHSGIHVLNTEAAALANLTKLYEVDAVARDGFNASIKAITRLAKNKGKLVIIGVGKSGHIGKKLVATFQSLAIRSVFLHPTEALHGDLGIVGPEDTLLFITYSGKTQELLLTLPHLDERLPTILLTSHMRRESCEFVKHRPNTILLPAPIPEPESVSFGVSAPSASTTAALALGDALALTAAHELHPSVSTMFAKNHPGGAIGAAVAVAARGPQTLGHISVPWDEVDVAESLSSDGPATSLLRAAYNSKTGWVRVGDEIAVPSKIRTLSDADMVRPIKDVAGLTVSRQQMLAMSSETTVRQARDILEDMQSSQLEEQELGAGGSGSVIAITNSGNIIGVLEVEQVLEHQDA